MPEHVHLLLSEPQQDTLADGLTSLKQGVSRRLLGTAPLKPKSGQAVSVSAGPDHLLNRESSLLASQGLINGSVHKLAGKLALGSCGTCTYLDQLR
jgi:REP element-mobilizing transposase RayT